MRRLLMVVAFSAALGVPVPAQADSLQPCTPPQYMHNFGIPIAATPSLWLNPSCAGPQSGRRCAWSQLPSDGCINYPPGASLEGANRADTAG